MQILPQRQDWGSALGQGLGQGVAQGVNEHYQDQRQLKQTEKMSKLQQTLYEDRAKSLMKEINDVITEPSYPGASQEEKLVRLATPLSKYPDLPMSQHLFKQMAEIQQLQTKRGIVQNILQGNQNPNMGQPNASTNQMQLPPNNMQQDNAPSNIQQQTQPQSNDLLANNRPSKNNGVGLDINKLNTNQLLNIQQFDKPLFDSIQKLKEEESKNFIADREYHTKQAQPSIDEANALRTSIRKSKEDINLAKLAVENGDLGAFTGSHLADLTGNKAFQSYEGAMLEAATKNYLLNNISRVQGRPNMWLEQQISGMFAKPGRSKQGNLAILDFLEYELDRDSKYLKEFDSLSEESEKLNGYVTSQVAKKAARAIEPYEEQQQKRLMYKLQERKEVDEGPLAMYQFKKVTKGTPLTKEKATAIKQHFKGDSEKANAFAKKLGYVILPMQSTGEQNGQ